MKTTSYLSLGSTKTVVNGEERPQCVMCLNVLSSENMKPSKLKGHLKSKHSEFFKNPDGFAKNRSELKRAQRTSSKAASVQAKARLASYRASRNILFVKLFYYPQQLTSSQFYLANLWLNN